MRLAVLLSLAILTLPSHAQEPRDFRIATAGTSGTYFPIGGLIATAISAPPGSRPCAEGGACGVPGLTATPISTQGSVENVEAIVEKRLESAFVQADVATWAATGSGIWEGRPPATDLVAIANLYPEAVHIVARARLRVDAVAELGGLRVSLDERGSGTLVEARLILRAAGLGEDAVEPSYLPAEEAAEAMASGALDAFFFAGGYPAQVITDLAERVPIRLVPVTGFEAAAILDRYEFFAPDLIPAGTYPGQEADVPTVGVTAQWVTHRDQPEDLIHAITTALWNETTRRLLDAGHAKGAQVRLETALDGIGIDLHPGAERFYREAGMWD
jgi:TRAP transporter TAXI family solute receptor